MVGAISAIIGCNLATRLLLLKGQALTAHRSEHPLLSKVEEVLWKVSYRGGLLEVIAVTSLRHHSYWGDSIVGPGSCVGREPGLPPIQCAF